MERKSALIALEPEVIRVTPIVTVRHWRRSDRELVNAYIGSEKPASKTRGTLRVVRKESE